MAPNNQTLCGPSQKSGAHQDSRRDYVFTGQRTLPPTGFGSRNGSSLGSLGQYLSDNPNCFSIGFGGSFLTQFGKGSIRNTATPDSITVVPSSLPSLLPPPLPPRIHLFLLEPPITYITSSMWAIH